MYEVTGTTRLPYSAICYIRVQFPDGKLVSGSGVVVGANDVLTAMHVIFDAARGGYASSITIYPGADTQPTLLTPFGTFTNWGRVNSRTNNWDNNGDGLLSSSESQYDLALIGMRSRIGDTTGWLGLTNSSADTTATMLGYPGLGTGLMAERVYADASSFTGVFNMSKGLGKGGSGGPLISDANQVLGISSAGDLTSGSAVYAGLFGPGNWDWLIAAIRDNDALIGSTASPAPAPAPAPSGANRSGGSADDFFLFSRFDPPGPITISDTGGRDIFNAYLVPGNHLINLNSGATSSIGHNTVTIAMGTVIEDAIAFDGNDILTGNGANNTLWARGGNDRLTGGGGNDYLDGGVGIDTAVFTGARAGYRVDVALKVVTDLQTGRDGTDTLVNIERLKFSDTSVALDINGNAGQAYRIYNAALDRTPDLKGLGDWIYALDAGINSLKQVAQGFINSAEFQTKYGVNSSDQTFITLLYNNVLKRNPDAGGYADWQRALDQGQSRSDLLVGFSESPEYQDNALILIGNGIHYQDYLLG